MASLVFACAAPLALHPHRAIGALLNALFRTLTQLSKALDVRAFGTPRDAGLGSPTVSIRLRNLA